MSFRGPPAKINYVLTKEYQFWYGCDMSIVCEFCDIVAGKAPARIEHEWPEAIAIHTHRPKSPGHLLVLPKKHIQDANEDPELAAIAMKHAASIAIPPCHLSTNLGGAAAQTVFHMHFHIIPRVAGQGVAVSWFNPWNDHRQDRKILTSTSKEKPGPSFSTELSLTSKTLSLKTNVSLTKSIGELLTGLWR